MEFNKIYLVVKNNKNYLKTFSSLEELDEFTKKYIDKDELLKENGFLEGNIYAYYLSNDKINFLKIVYKYDLVPDINFCLKEIEEIINYVDNLIKDNISYRENDINKYLHFLHKKKYVLSLEEKASLKNYIMFRNQKYKKRLLSILKNRFLMSSSIILLKYRTFSSKMISSKTNDNDNKIKKIK